MSFTSSLLRSTPRLASRTAFSSASLASRHASRRFLATTPGQSGQSSSGGSSNAFLYGLLGAGVLGGGAYYVSQRDPTADEDPRKIRDAASPKEVDYQKVYNAVAEVLEQEDYDGEFRLGFLLFPFVVGKLTIGSHEWIRWFIRSRSRSSRVALLRNLRQGIKLWRIKRVSLNSISNINSINQADLSPDSDSATMRFAPEANHGANAGLEKARARLEAVKTKFPEISYSDLWTLAGVVAVQELGGPYVPWRAGRKDGNVGKHYLLSFSTANRANFH